MAATTTTPAGKPVNRKNLMQIVGAHGIPYAATASVGYVDDLRKKVQKAKDTDGPSFLHIHAPCPTGWGYAPAKTIELAKLAVTSRCWNLYEMVNGKEIRITKKIKNVTPVKAYLEIQKRFRKVTDAGLIEIQSRIDAEYAYLERLAEIAG